MKSDFLTATAKVEAAAVFLQSPFLVARLCESMQAAVIRVSGPWLSRQDAADYCRCGLSEIDRAANVLKLFKRYHRGGSPVFKRSEIDAAIESGKWAPGTSPNKIR